jgi:hypothetical protein
MMIYIFHYFLGNGVITFWNSFDCLEFVHLVVAKPDLFFRKRASKKLDFAVIYVDLFFSTIMSMELTTEL